MAVDIFNLADVSGLLRNDSAADTQRIQSNKIPNVLSPEATHPTVYREVLNWMPTRWDLKIAEGISSTGVYPVDGGTTPTQGALNDNQIKLHASATPAKGMIVHVLDGTGAKGEWGIIDTVDGGAGDPNTPSASNVCTIHRDWVSNPDSSGQTTRLMIPCWVASYAVVKTEFSVDNRYITAVLLFYDLGITMDGSTRRASIVAPDGPHQINTTGDGAVASSQADTEESSYYHGKVLQVPAIGGVGYKIDVRAAPSTGVVSIWAGWV